MKRLCLLRHAKSGWDEPAARDFDRALNARGRRGARTMGRFLRDEKIAFDRVVASPAVRVVETLDALGEGYGEALAPQFVPRLYLAAAATLLDQIHETPDAVGSLLLSGHNPGMEELVLLLANAREGEALRLSVEEKFPTAAFVELDFDVAHWADVAAGGGRLARFVRPRDLDAALGPEGRGRA
jgi:phosphohistidine phosphatase